MDDELELTPEEEARRLLQEYGIDQRLAGESPAPVRPPPPAAPPPRPMGGGLSALGDPTGGRRPPAIPPVSTPPRAPAGDSALGPGSAAARPPSPLSSPSRGMGGAPRAPSPASREAASLLEGYDVEGQLEPLRDMEIPVPGREPEAGLRYDRGGRPVEPARPGISGGVVDRLPLSPRAQRIEERLARPGGEAAVRESTRRETGPSISRRDLASAYGRQTASPADRALIERLSDEAAMARQEREPVAPVDRRAEMRSETAPASRPRERDAMAILDGYDTSAVDRIEVPAPTADSEATRRALADMQAPGAGSTLAGPERTTVAAPAAMPPAPPSSPAAGAPEVDMSAATGGPTPAPSRPAAGMALGDPTRGRRVIESAPTPEFLAEFDDRATETTGRARDLGSPGKRPSDRKPVEPGPRMITQSDIDAAQVRDAFREIPSRIGRFFRGMAGRQQPARRPGEADQLRERMSEQGRALQQSKAAQEQSRQRASELALRDRQLSAQEADRATGRDQAERRLSIQEDAASSLAASREARDAAARRERQLRADATSDISRGMQARFRTTIATLRDARLDAAADALVAQFPDVSAVPADRLEPVLEMFNSQAYRGAARRGTGPALPGARTGAARHEALADRAVEVLGIGRDEALDRASTSDGRDDLQRQIDAARTEERRAGVREEMEDRAGRIPGWDRTPDAPELTPTISERARGTAQALDALEGASSRLADLADEISTWEVGAAGLLGWQSDRIAEAIDLQEDVSNALRTIGNYGVPQDAEMRRMERLAPAPDSLNWLLNAARSYRSLPRTARQRTERLMRDWGYVPQGSGGGEESPAPRARGSGRTSAPRERAPARRSGGGTRSGTSAGQVMMDPGGGRAPVPVDADRVEAMRRLGWQEVR